jgi:serine/threonine-protein kinase HipA
MMQLAAAVSLSVATVEPRTAASRPYLLVERYDREVQSANNVRRLHQEDFCQALAILPERKYQTEGGPTLRQCFDLLRRATTTPAIEVLKLLDAVIFNVLIGNADAHGKNYSLLYTDTGLVLAPLYDLVCTVAYEGISQQFAMKVGKCANLEEMSKNTWTTFADEIGVGAPYIRRRIKELTESVGKRVRGVAERLAVSGLDKASVLHFASIVETRAVRLADTA